MKYLLVVTFALVSLPVWAADPASATAATGSPPPASTPAKAALREKFGEDWKAKTENKDLLVDERIKGEAGNNVNVSQEETYGMVSEVFVQCAEVSSEGRKDEVCANDPTNPECAGVAGSIANATNCLEYFTPKSLGCKTFGTSEYSQVEWFAVGDLFVDKIKDCKSNKDAYDSKIKNSVKLNSVTEMIGAGDYLRGLAGGPNMRGSSFNPNSQISGNLKSEMEIGSTDWESLASRIKDGASQLGYQDGDIIRASLKGESFASIVSQSPFAKNQLNYEQRAKLEEGLAESKMISQRVVQSHREKNGADTAAEASTPAQNSQPTAIQIVDSSATRQPDAGESNSTGGAMAPGGAGAAREAKASAAAEVAGTDEARNRAMLEAERQEAVFLAAALARSEKRAYRSPASVMQSKVEDLLDTTLFQRISQTYRRKSSGMRGLDTRSGDLIRSIEKPEIFRSL